MCILAQQTVFNMFPVMNSYLMNSRILAKPPDLLNSSEFLGSCPKFLSKACHFLMPKTWLKDNICTQEPMTPMSVVVNF